ncbi:MAG: Aromatic-L-amino-acid decarboxylase [uncultured Thermomicrobiales bacterium]|uniref:Aromatic-L-amino-acid decarboxylase n=1 Tax=uncultured Thermomicrobiales bacterium TaxID=1645740 RepID=A0A6J4UDU9_9BACT|nr:MAG: Aromatic-L-amino-acid decarboxylase [uncultured Thermomicrobiales bacterium]
MNSPPAHLGVLAELLAAAMDPSAAGGDHAAIYVERVAVRWLMGLVGYPTDGSMGILVSGGSMASLTCLAAARHRLALRHGWNDRQDGMTGDRPSLVVYLSSEAHTTLHKAVELLGLGTRCLRVIPVDADFRIDIDALRTAITVDRAAGLLPFCVAASAGTVATGAIDRFDLLADLCVAEDLWLHVDGAYGAVGILDPDRSDRYAGMDRADSLAIDPHKWLSVPVECGCAIVRDGALLRDTFSLVPSYVRTEEGRGIGGLPWYSEYGFQQSRGFRALKLWMALQHAGRDGYARIVSRHNAQARTLAGLIDAAPDLERLAPVELSIVCFRYRPAGMPMDDERLDGLNKAIMEEIQSSGDAFVTQASIGGRFSLRANIIHYGTTDDDLQVLIDAVRAVGGRLATASKGER